MSRNEEIYAVMEKFIGKFKKNAQRAGEWLEMGMAVVVLLGVLLSIYSLLKDFEVFRFLAADTAAFKPFLEEVFVIVIGIEFLQMLCRPNSDNVMEVLLFLVARHMIVGDTTPFEDFVSVVSVGILCVLRRYLRVMKDREKEKEKGKEKGKGRSAGQTAGKAAGQEREPKAEPEQDA